jgi:hypothetical protein
MYAWLAPLIEPLPHLLNPSSRRLGAEQLPRPCAGFRVGALLREPFLDGGPLAHRPGALGPCRCNEQCQRSECETELSQHGGPRSLLRDCPAFVTCQWHPTGTLTRWGAGDNANPFWNNVAGVHLIKAIEPNLGEVHVLLSALLRFLATYLTN